MLPPLKPPELPPDIPPPNEPLEAPPPDPPNDEPPYAGPFENSEVLLSEVFVPLADLSDVFDVDLEESSADATRCEEFERFPV